MCDHWLTLSLLTNLLTKSCLVDLTDVTLVFENAHSKLFDVVSVADVDVEERVDDSLVKIFQLGFGKGFKPRQDFEAEVKLRL